MAPSAGPRTYDTAGGMALAQWAGAAAARRVSR
jgi:hypothetical protein